MEGVLGSGPELIPIPKDAPSKKVSVSHTHQVAFCLGVTAIFSPGETSEEHLTGYEFI